MTIQRPGQFDLNGQAPDPAADAGVELHGRRLGHGEAALSAGAVDLHGQALDCDGRILNCREGELLGGIQFGVAEPERLVGNPGLDRFAAEIALDLSDGDCGAGIDPGARWAGQIENN